MPIDINNGAELDLESSEELAKSYSLPISRPPENILRDRGSYINTLGTVKARQAITAYERQTLDELVRKGYDIKLTNPIEFLRQQYASLGIHRYIQTHPDLDHMRGLSALSQNREIVNFWDTKHSKIPEFQSGLDKEEWTVYQELRTQPKYVFQLYRGSNGAYWNQDPPRTLGGHGIEILSPTLEIVEVANKEGKTNNLSYILQVSSQFFGEREKPIICLKPCCSEREGYRLERQGWDKTSMPHGRAHS